MTLGIDVSRLFTDMMMVWTLSLTLTEPFSLSPSQGH
jgi:hypothetical protein